MDNITEMYNSMKDRDSDKLAKQTTVKGLIIYLTLPIMWNTGFYRLYDDSNWKFTIFLGYSIEFFL